MRKNYKRKNAISKQQRTSITLSRRLFIQSR